MPRPSGALQRALVAWYDGARRDLPWRMSRDPYRIWISEIMLQQTRVGAVLPYYERFLTRFPDVAALAGADESDLLHAWSGLGYYSRARNLQRAAAIIMARGSFPCTLETIAELPGVGPYTAAAIASIALGLPHAAVDGNVLRVLSRITNDAGDIGSSMTRDRLHKRAVELLDRSDPGRWNQAVMELGATACTPKQPRCEACPIRRWCEARRTGRAAELPVKLRRTAPVSVWTELLLIERPDGALLLRRRPDSADQMAGFWELPDRALLPDASIHEKVHEFRHSITNTRYRISVLRAALNRAPAGAEWVSRERFPLLPLSTITRKALRY